MEKKAGSGAEGAGLSNRLISVQLQFILFDKRLKLKRNYQGPRHHTATVNQSMNSPSSSQSNPTKKPRLPQIPQVQRYTDTNTSRYWRMKTHIWMHKREVSKSSTAVWCDLVTSDIIQSQFLLKPLFRQRCRHLHLQLQQNPWQQPSRAKWLISAAACHGTKRQLSDGISSSFARRPLVFRHSLAGRDSETIAVYLDDSLGF